MAENHVDFVSKQKVPEILLAVLFNYLSYLNHFFLPIPDDLQVSF